MNTQHRDIITAIGRKQPITTSDVAEYLMDHFGYGGGMEFGAFRDQVSKTIGYLKSKGDIVGYDAPQEKGKPLRHWLLAHPQSDCQSAEMASDITEINHESLVETWESDAHAHSDDAPQIAASDAVPVSDQTEAQAGWASEAVADTSQVLGISVQARHEAQTPKPATPIPVGEAIAEYASYRWGEKESYLEGFLYGISFAERYHGIFDAD